MFDCNERLEIILVRVQIAIFVVGLFSCISILKHLNFACFGSLILHSFPEFCFWRDMERFLKNHSPYLVWQSLPKLVSFVDGNLAILVYSPIHPLCILLFPCSYKEFYH